MQRQRAQRAARPRRTGASSVRGPRPPATAATDGATRLLIGLPFMLALLAYLPALRFDFIWDDVTFIVTNPAAQELHWLGTTLRHGYGWVSSAATRVDSAMYYRPVVTAVNTLHWVLSSGEPWLFHLGNLLTHALCALLLAIFALRLGLSVAAALLAAGLFALHPLHSEPVAWISGRTDLTAAAFGLLALLLLTIPGRVSSTGRRDAARFLCAGLALLLALASKESAIAVGILAIVWVAVPGLHPQIQDGRLRPVSAARGQRDAPADVRPGAAQRQPGWPSPRRTLAVGILFCSLIVYLLLRLWVLGHGIGCGEIAALQGDHARAALTERLLLSGNLFLVYLQKLVAPWPLSIEPPQTLREMPYPLIPGVLGLLVLASVGIFWLWLLRQVRRSACGSSRTAAARWTARPAAWLGLGLFLLALAPVLQWIPVGEIYGERFLYLSSAGLLLFASAAFDGWLGRRPMRTLLIGVALGIPALILLQLRLPDWRDEIRLFRSAVEVHPESPRALANLGTALAEDGQLPEALPYLERAVELDPDDRLKQAQYGSLLVNLGRVDEGVLHLERAYAQGFRATTLLKNLGIAWSRLGRFAESAEVLQQALLQNPQDASLCDALGFVERKRGRYGDAVDLFQRAIALDPGRKSAYLNLIGLHYFDRRDWEAARLWGRRFLTRFPEAPEAVHTRAMLEQDPRAIPTDARGEASAP